MPKLYCPCGNFIHNLSNIPDDGFLTVRDRDYEELLETEKNRTKLCESQPKSETKEWEELIISDARIIKLTERIYECPECNRLMWMKKNGMVNIYEQTNIIKY
ncbi:hypothetical protein [Gorillibacterium sp. sgz5001074]|uniref:hypothetical protein n=1 Tax=Gorillibacterium sp. sgz5001074 TaxID=3446695 RepID=UPI003F664BD7